MGFIIVLFVFVSGLLQAGEPDLLIAYNVLHDKDSDNYEIFVMESTGKGKKNISNNKAVDWVYYAHESKLYFLSDRDAPRRKFHLYEMDADGNNVRKISSFLLRDSWFAARKSATEFVVCSEKDGNPELYLIDSNGKELKRLTHNAVLDSDPSFSPDGRQIVFRSERSGLDELWLINTDGGGTPKQLTHYKGPELKYGYHAAAPRWIGKYISYATKRDHSYSIYTINPNGDEQQRITPKPFDELWHHWTADGRWLVYDGTDAWGNYDIYIMRNDGKVRRKLTTDPTPEQAPVFVKRPK